MLTGWPQEDLLDALGGTPLEGGSLFARLEEVLGGPLRAVQVRCFLRKESYMSLLAPSCMVLLQTLPCQRQLPSRRKLLMSTRYSNSRHGWMPCIVLQYALLMLSNLGMMPMYALPFGALQELPAVASCCLIKRSKPQRAPPRLVVLSGPSGVGCSRLIARLVAEFPDKFGVTVSHTTRPPREHEVDGK